MPAWTRFFTKSIGAGEFVCGPELRYVRQGKIHTFEATVEPATLSFRRLPEGRVLLRSGPTIQSLNEFAAGACGACPVVSLSMYVLDAKEVRRVLDEAILVGNEIADAEIRFSPDWRTITFYSEQDEVWSSKRYCFDGAAYQVCGTGPGGAPRGPRQVTIPQV